jgi:hypothetical protein
MKSKLSLLLLWVQTSKTLSLGVNSFWNRRLQPHRQTEDVDLFICEDMETLNLLVQFIVEMLF